MATKLRSAPEVANLLGVQLDTLYRYARAGKLRGLKIGKLWRFTESDVDAFIESRRPDPHDNRFDTRLLTDILGAPPAGAGDLGGIIANDTAVSRRQLDLLADRFALALIEAGVRPGDRVAVMLPNSIEFVVVCFAVWKARAILVADDSMIRPDSLRHLLDDATPTVAVLDRNVAAHLEAMHGAFGALSAVFVKDRTFALSGRDIRVESLDEALAADSDAPSRLPGGASPDDVVSIIYTSGSTGKPKGVMHTHASWLAGAEFSRDYPTVTAHDKLVIPLPLHHAYAFRQLLAYLLADATVLIADIYQALKLLREQRPTALLLVPAACNIVLDHFAPILREADAYLRYVEIGSAAMPAEHLQRLKDLLPTTHVHLPYGLTEARVAFLEAGPDGQLNRIATLSPGLDLRLVDRSGSDVAPGETGEILLQGRGLMRGYWGHPQSEHDALVSDGFRTGDMGRRGTDGRVALLGRLDEVFKVGGRKVNPYEVESALNRHPAIVESAVTAVPDPRGVLDRALHAFVVLRRGATLNESELQDHCRRHVEPYKVPSRVHFRSSLPKSSVGKILRQMLAGESIELTTV